MNKNGLSMDKVVFGEGKTLPIDYIENALREGKNIAVAGKNTCKKTLFAKSILAHHPERRIYLAEGSNPASMMKLYPDRLEAEKYWNGKDGIFYIDESECGNMWRILPEIVLDKPDMSRTGQILSVYEADNNKQTMIKTTRMLQQYSMEPDWDQCSRIVCKRLCGVCIVVTMQKSHLIINEIWENRLDARGHIEQQMIMLYTDCGYFVLPEDEGIWGK